MSAGHSNEYSASMHWGMACITARADVYAMMMGSLTDDQTRHSPDYIGKTNVCSVSIKKKWVAPIYIVLCPIPRHCCSGGSNAHIVFSARTICNPNPRHYGISCAESKHWPKLLLCACEMCVCVCFFACFCFVTPRGRQKVLNIFF